MLRDAVRLNDPARVNEIIDAIPRPPSVTLTATMTKAQKQRLPPLMLLSDIVDGGDAKDRGWTPAVHAAFNGREECLEILLLKGEANPDKTTHNGSTPLIFAACNGHAGCIRLLLQFGADSSISSHDGWSPFLWASFNGHAACLEVLLAHARKAAAAAAAFVPAASPVLSIATAHAYAGFSVSSASQLLSAAAPSMHSGSPPSPPSSPHLSSSSSSSSSSGVGA